MDLNLQNKISEYLKAERNQAIINSDEFYFQKAQDVLQNFLNLKVGENVKKVLVAKKKNYEELKKLFQDSEDFSEFGTTIFSLVSYCDQKAYKKNELNQYNNKRVLASAFVRMNNWLEQLITYKFDGQLSEGSVKNAMEYLLHPEDHFTMLSENHRSLISENLFKKNYNKNTFKQDYLEFFSDMSIQIKNPLNYTHLLSCLSYDISPEWKESIIGLMSPDGTGWQDGAINDLNGADYIILWNHRKPNGTTKTFKLLKDCIDENGSFKIFYTSKNNAIYIAEVIDFATSAQEYNKADWENNYENITWKLDSFDEYKDGDKSASWVYLVNKFYQIEPIPSSHFKYYFPSGYPSVGSQTPIISMISNIEFKKNQNMKKNIELLQYKKQIILQGPPGTGKTREAKQIAQNILGLDEKQIQESEQFKIIQFHPSYTYEDFVRGIVAKPNPDGEGILYETENKILGEFAKKALDNYLLSKGVTTINDEFEERLNILLTNVNDAVSQGNTYSFGDKSTAEIIYSTNTGFVYRFPKFISVEYNLLFDDLRKVYERRDEIKIPIDLRDKEKAFGLKMKGKYTYYFMLNKQLENIDVQTKKFEEEKPFVLTIDEINRANLSSVLGELIYALEYRGEEVESMYELDGSQKLILPPNLYIIGTMNTADRSVGHIDYAIRRRFAFVEVLPKDLSSEMKDGEFYKDLFNAVKILFTTDDYQTKSDFISQEFEPKDVALGHSYFIDKSDDGGNVKIRWNYEIKPILLEYVRDGVLKVGALEQINSIENTFELKIE